MAIAQQAQEFNRTPSKSKKDRFAHTANTKYGMGDNYGQGLRQPLGRVRDGGYSPGFVPVPKTKMGKPPKSLA